MTQCISWVPKCGKSESYSVHKYLLKSTMGRPWGEIQTQFMISSNLWATIVGNNQWKLRLHVTIWGSLKNVVTSCNILIPHLICKIWLFFKLILYFCTLFSIMQKITMINIEKSEHNKTKILTLNVFTRIHRFWGLPS